MTRLDPSIITGGGAQDQRGPVDSYLQMQRMRAAFGLPPLPGFDPGQAQLSQVGGGGRPGGQIAALAQFGGDRGGFRQPVALPPPQETPDLSPYEIAARLDRLRQLRGRR